MTTSLLIVDGMVHRHTDLVIEHLIDHAAVDGDGRLLVAMVDVLAMAQLDADAELVQVRYADGASCLVRVAEIIEGGNVFLELQVRHRPDLGSVRWCVRLWSYESGLSPQVASICATSFASFVGLA